jgi:N-acetylneuraminate synthase
MEFTEEQWRGLKTHAEERDLVFLSSVFSPAAVELLSRIRVPAWKIGSGEISNVPLIHKMAVTRLPVLISSGMSGIPELDEAVACVRRHGAPVAVLQCTTSYPTAPENIGLNLISEFQKRYRCPAGLSDHSGTIWAGLAAAALGADILEVHVTFSRQGFGPDVPASVTIGELGQLALGLKFVRTAILHPVDKDEAASRFEEMRTTFGKSIVAARLLAAGTTLTEADLALKKPGGGIPPGGFELLLGKKLRRSLEPDELVQENDVI